MMPFFSICMPAYNVEDYIDVSIMSVINQTFQDWELIIVDDGSKDKSGSIADRYADLDNRIRVIHKENAGLLSARRCAIKKIAGIYTLFLDSDDYIEVDMLEKLHNKIIENKEPDIVLFGANEFTSKMRKAFPYPFQEGFLKKSEVLDYFISSHKLNTLWTKAIKSALLLADPTDYSRFYGNSYGEDKLQLMFPFTKAETFYFVNDRFYNYRQNENSMLHSYSLEALDKRLHLYLWKELRRYLDIWGLNDLKHLEMYSLYYLRHILEMFDVYYYRGNDRKNTLSYNWSDYIPPEVLRFRTSKKLRLKEKIKLFSILHHTDFIIRLYDKLLHIDRS